jgi:hypothetical protein
MSRALRRALRQLGRVLRLLVFCLMAIGPNVPPPPPPPRRDREVQVDGAEKDDVLP